MNGNNTSGRRIRGGDDDNNYDNNNSNVRKNNFSNNNNNNNNNGEGGSSFVDEALQQQELSLALRQAAVRCLHRFEQDRLTTFDRLLANFALYYANSKSLPFVKLIYDSQYREEYEDLEAMLAKVLLTNSSSNNNATADNQQKQQQDASNNKFDRRRFHHNAPPPQQITVDEMKQTLDELNTIVEAVALDQISTNEKILQEKQMFRTMNAGNMNNNNNNNGDGDGDDEVEDYFDDGVDEDAEANGGVNGSWSDDDDDGAEEDAIDDEQQQQSYFGETKQEAKIRQQRRELQRRKNLLRRHQRVLHLAGFFKICKDFLENGQAVAISMADESSALHPAIVDEAAALVARAGTQLPRAIVTLEVLALAEDTPGIDTQFYRVIAQVARFALARQEIVTYVNRFKRSEDDKAPPPPPLPSTLAQQPTSRAGASSAIGDDAERIAQLNKKQTKQEAEFLMERSGEGLNAGEMAFVDEVVLNNQGHLVVAASAGSTTTTMVPTSENDANNTNNTNILEGRLGGKKEYQTFQTSASLVLAQSKSNPDVLIKLVKPERFAKLILGFNNTNFNRTHYNAENPPPKHVQAYEFTLFYPGKSDPSRPPGFKLYPTEKGWDDEYCFIEFYGGPPYAKVAYRIVNRKWAPLPGGRQPGTWDVSGKFVFKIRFASSGYRR